MAAIHDVNELVKRYKDFVSDINDLTLRDKLNQVPSEKAYWAQILSDYERTLHKLQTQLKIKIREKSASLIANAPVSLSKNIVDKVKEDPDLDAINHSIQRIELDIKNFGRIYENIKYIAKDFENILKYKQLQDS